LMRKMPAALIEHLRTKSPIRRPGTPPRKARRQKPDRP
jgi:hypothetical protein